MRNRFHVLTGVVFCVIFIKQCHSRGIPRENAFEIFKKIIDEFPKEDQNDLIRYTVLWGYTKSHHNSHRHMICLPPPIGCFDPDDPPFRPNRPGHTHMSYREFDHLAVSIYEYYKEDTMANREKTDLVCFPPPIGCRRFNNQNPRNGARQVDELYEFE